jgi:hypothetical protein
MASPTPPLVAREYAELTPEALGDGYNEATLANVGLPLTPSGYGLLLCEDANGTHWTSVTEDVEYHRMLVEAERSGADLGEAFQIPNKYPMTRAGWPDEWREGESGG